MSLNQNNLVTDSGKYTVPGGTKSGESPDKRRPPAPAASAGSGGSGKRNVTLVDSDGTRQTGVADYTDPYWSAMRDYYNTTYNAQVAANNAAAEDAYARAAEAAREQKEQLSAGYQNTNRQLYRDYMESRRVLPQQLAAHGYSGGLSESSRLRLANAYGENLAGNERARLSEEAAVNAALAQREYETRAAAAEANNQALQNYNAYLAALRTQQYQQQRSDAANRAAVLAAAGDYSGYGALGYSQEDVDYLGRMWRRQNPRLAAYQATGQIVPPVAAAPADNSVAAVARYLRQTRSAEEAVNYVAEELAAGNIFSDEAERLWKELRG